MSLNEAIVDNYIADNGNLQARYDKADITRLDDSNYITAKITTQEIYNIIKQLKNNTFFLFMIYSILHFNPQEDVIIFFESYQLREKQVRK